MDSIRGIVSRLHESFLYGDFIYYKYKGYFKRHVDGGDPVEIEEPEYSKAKDLRNEREDIHSKGHEDLDDETIEDVKKLTYLQQKIVSDDSIEDKYKEFYLGVLNHYLDNSQLHNIPLQNYEPADAQSSYYRSTLYHLMKKYNISPSSTSNLEDFQSIRRKYRDSETEEG